MLLNTRVVIILHRWCKHVSSKNFLLILPLFVAALDLIEHLRAMGETNALLERNKILNRETAVATAAIYDSMFATEDGTIPATFQVCP